MTTSVSLSRKCVCCSLTTQYSILVVVKVLVISSIVIDGHSIPGREVLPKMTSTRNLFQGLGILRGTDFTRLKVHEGAGKSVISLYKKAKKLTYMLYCCEKVKKTLWFCKSFIFKRQ